MPHPPGERARFLKWEMLWPLLDVAFRDYFRIVPFGNRPSRVSTPEAIEILLRNPFLGWPAYEALFPLGNPRLAPKTPFCVLLLKVCPSITCLFVAPTTRSLGAWRPMGRSGRLNENDASWMGKGKWIPLLPDLLFRFGEFLSARWNMVKICGACGVVWVRMPVAKKRTVWKFPAPLHDAWECGGFTTRSLFLAEAPIRRPRILAPARATPLQTTESPSPRSSPAAPLAASSFN